MQAPEFLGPLALIFLAALGAAYVLHRLGQPPLIGFLLAGVLLGPFGLGLVRNLEVVEALADLGVVLLLFTVGLELSLGNLRRLGKIVWIAGPIQVAVTIALVYIVAAAGGYPGSRGLFFGYLVALSSTAIVLKLLMDRREMDSAHGKALVGILIFQDLAVVPMLLSLPFLVGGATRGLVPVLLGRGQDGRDRRGAAARRPRSRTARHAALSPEPVRRRSSSSRSSFSSWARRSRRPGPASRLRSAPFSPASCSRSRSTATRRWPTSPPSGTPSTPCSSCRSECSSIHASSCTSPFFVAGPPRLDPGLEDVRRRRRGPDARLRPARGDGRRAVARPDRRVLLRPAAAGALGRPDLGRGVPDLPRGGDRHDDRDARSCPKRATASPSGFRSRDPMRRPGQAAAARRARPRDRVRPHGRDGGPRAERARSVRSG